jgi:hypothetical protein
MNIDFDFDLAQHVVMPGGQRGTVVKQRATVEVRNETSDPQVTQHLLIEPHNTGANGIQCTVCGEETIWWEANMLKALPK